MTTDISFSDEELDIISRGRADGTYMKAPDGRPTSLNERQWVQVRTKAFKEWFGDWENAPETASKVVDAGGEPLVVYHGTPLRRDRITPERGWQRDGVTYIPQKAPFHTFKGGGYSGLIFTSVDAEKARSIAEMRAMGIPDDKYGNEQWTEEGYVYDLYANSRNPFDPQNEKAVRKILQALGDEIPVLSFYGGKGGTVSPETALELASSERNSWMLTETPEFLSRIKEEGYDGLAGYDEGVKYIAVMSPNQLKDAYDNTGGFSTSNDDIRFREVWHGSPNSFATFDHSFMGTGEGAQSYGWGTYVTEVEGIARRYAAIGIRRGGHITYNGEDFSAVLDNEYYFDDVWRVWKTHLLSSTDPDSLKRNVASVYIDGRTTSSRSKRRKEFEKQKAELLADIDSGKIRVELPRNLYTVNIPDDNGMNYLYWDRPVSPEQQGRIFLQLRKERFFLSEATAEFWSGKSHVWNSGKEFYSFLDYMFIEPDRNTDSQRLTSEFLSRAGFTGIDYPAEYSAGGRADGARNYVIFKERDLKIVSHERFRFIGETGAASLDRAEGVALRLDNLAVANEMENSDRNAGAIKMATGWERGADGKWRYETPDFEYYPAGNLGCSRLLERQPWHKDFENLLDRLIAGETLGKPEQKRFAELTELAAGLERQDAMRERIYLDDYVGDDGLFRAYPRLRQTRLEFLDLPSAGYSGSYFHPDNRIVINISKADDAKSVLVHEIQHAIQHIEGFAHGSSPEEFRNTAEDVIRDIVRATGGKILEDGGFDNTPKGIFAALNRETAYGGTILRDNSSGLDMVAGKYGYKTIFDLVNDIGSFKSGVQMYRSTAGEVEARNVQKRMDMTMQERLGSLASLTEDIPRGEQILLSGDSADSLAEYAGSLAEKQHIPVRIIRSAGEVGSPEAFRLISAGKDIRGWYDINSDSVCLYLPNARGQTDVERTLLHEGVAHYGLRKFAGHKHMDAFLDDIFNGCGEKVRDEILRMAAADRTDIRVATEEYLARMAENGTDRSLWDRIVTAFRNLLRKLGFRLEIDTRELRGILAASRKNLTRIAEPAVIQTTRGDLELSCGYGRAILRRQGVETDATSLLNRMRKAGISPASLGQEDWKAVFNGGMPLPGGRKLMAVREPAGYGMRISGVSPESARESGMEM